MYTNIFIPLTSEDIKKVNASKLATKYGVSNSYVSRVLKTKKAPTSDKAKKIMDDAIAITKPYIKKSYTEE